VEIYLKITNKRQKKKSHKDDEVETALLESTDVRLDKQAEEEGDEIL